MKSTGMRRRTKGLKSGGSLQPGKGLARHAALKPGGQPPRRVELVRFTSLERTSKPTVKNKTAKPKQRPEGYVPEGYGRKVVDKRSQGWCEVQLLGICLGRGHSHHHRVDRSLGGTWNPAGLLKTCGDGTRGCHGWITDNPKQAREEGGWALKGHEKPDQVPVLIASPLWPGERRWVLLDSKGGTQPAEVAA